MARTSQRPLKKRWNYNPDNSGRPMMALTWVANIDTLETYDMKRTMKHHQRVAVRDMQLYSEARLVEVREGDIAVLHTFSTSQREIRVWLIDPNGKRTLERSFPHTE